VESLALVVEENRYCHAYMCTEITVLVTLVWYKKLQVRVQEVGGKCLNIKCKFIRIENSLSLYCLMLSAVSFLIQRKFVLSSGFPHQVNIKIVATHDYV